MEKLEKLDPGVFRHPDGKRLLFEPDHEYQVKTCCGPVTTCDKGLMEFLAKCVVSFPVLSFAMYQLSRGQQSEFASSTISLILGTYLGSSVAGAKSGTKEKGPVK
jgi:hypothetical protein